MPQGAQAAASRAAGGMGQPVAGSTALVAFAASGIDLETQMLRLRGMMDAMALAVELYFDPAGDAAIRDAWEALDRQGVVSLGKLDPHTAPHVSLAAVDDLDIDRAAVALAALRPTPLELRLGHMGSFWTPSEDLIAFIGVSPNDRLLELKRDAVTILDTLGYTCWDVYRPSRWVPHCTLTMAIPATAVARVATVAPRGLEVAVTSAGIYDVTTGRTTPITSATTA